MINDIQFSLGYVAQRQRDKCFKGLTQGKCFPKCTLDIPSTWKTDAITYNILVHTYVLTAD